MDINSIMSAQLSQLQHTVSVGMLKMVQATQTAGATVMMQDFAKTQESIHQSAQTAPHPSLGNTLDIKI